MPTVTITITDIGPGRVDIGFEVDEPPLPVTEAHKVGYIVHEVLDNEALFSEVNAMVLERKILEERAHEAH